MMKASIDLNSGLLIESQSDADDATLISNANSSGFYNVQVLSITGSELTALISARVPLSERIEFSIKKTYSDVDEIYDAAVGSRSEEYKQAETDARAYKAAGYAGTASPYISGWATAKGLTNQQSADSIIARADALVAAKLAMRNQRFASQAAMSAATTRAELDTAVAAWSAFIATTRTALGL